MDEKLRILLCEDDENLGMLLREYLQAKNFETELCPDGEAGYKAFLKGSFDLCVLDVMMPKKDGFSLAKDIRQNNSDIPIIFLTAKTLKEDVLDGFKIGADDYITKPYSIKNVLARVRTVLRRSGRTAAQDVLKCGSLCVSLHSKICTIDGKEVKMPKKEFEILALLMANTGRVYGRQEILNAIWPDKVIVVDRVVDVNVTRLRAKLGEYGKHIITKPGYGYAFVL